ncbi:ORF6N domain-containing protein [Castellaniella hirudinis]|uniref:ORF6N domain-containing protein n=1 Tax=Castellaniella hirudinis TaxID=1144617 RepID=UPI0039C0AE67
MSQIITINNVELPVVEYRGQRVVTLAMIDQAHERPKDTARRNFNENRRHFTEGEDFFQTTPSELREHIVRGTSEIPANKLVPLQGRGVTLLTESGYLMLVKSLQDDLAWQVQRQLVNNYFRRDTAAPIKRPSAPTSVLPGPAREFRAAHGIAKLIGLKGNQATLAANKATLRITGLNMLQALDAEKLIADDTEPHMTVTEIGSRFGRRAAFINDLLIAEGYQTRTSSKIRGKVRHRYTPTDKGKRYAVLVDMDKAHVAGKPIQNLEWKASIMPHLALALGGEAS